MVRKYIPAPLVETIRKLVFPIPDHLARHQRTIDSHASDAIGASIKRHYHTGWRSAANYSQAMYEDDLRAHLHARLDLDRRIVVPWLDRARSLSHARILEIGCGTGSSTIALAEQGAGVIGIDIDEDALAVAQVRCNVYGLNADFHALNASSIAAVFRERVFDFIIFFASLEHMTIAERLAALRDAWTMLPTGGMLVVVETPNRLWYYDGHTSQLPFFHWLPNELAFRYSAFSPRENFRELYRDSDAASEVHFLRRGRGMSFHEFDIAIKPANELKVLSSLSTFEGLRYQLRRSRLERKYKAMLRTIYPGIHEGFCDEMLYLIIEKD